MVRDVVDGKTRADVELQQPDLLRQQQQHHQNQQGNMASNNFRQQQQLIPNKKQIQHNKNNNNNKSSPSSTSSSQHYHHQLHIEDIDASNTTNLVDEGNQKNTKQNDNGGTFCTIKLCITMLLFLTITAVIIAILAFSLLDKSNDCLPSFHGPSYKLYTTKTTYSTTHNYLNRSSLTVSQATASALSLSVSQSAAQGSSSPPASSETSSSDTPMPSVYDNRVLFPIHLPTFLSSSEKTSLKQIDNDLANQGCRARQLHYIGRHAARYPSSKDIESINSLVQSVQNKIDLSKFASGNQDVADSSPTSATTDLPTPPDNYNNLAITINDGSADSANKTSAGCFNPLSIYKHWKTFMTPEQGNLIMKHGFEETNRIAARFKSIYPEMFDKNTAQINLGVTDAIRTAETAMAFVKEFDNFEFKFCDRESFPSDTSDKIKASEVNNNRCFKDMLSEFQREELDFHKTCKTYIKFNNNNTDLNIQGPERTQFIADALSAKLRLSKEQGKWLTTEETKALYKLCTYESALDGSSPWCNLFDESDLKFYEYLNDIEDFYNQAFVQSMFARSSCPLTGDMLKSFEAARNNTKSESFFRFTHSEVIQRLFAITMPSIGKDVDMTPRVVKKNLDAGSSPSKRQWRTSLITPFSANLAFVLYECPSSSMESKFKIVAALNEQPIKMDSCEELICDYDNFKENTDWIKEKKCDLESVCQAVTNYN